MRHQANQIIVDVAPILLLTTMKIQHNPLLPLRIFFLGCTLAANLSFANVPGGGNGTGANVTVKDNGPSVTLDNGLVSITIDKTNATIPSFTYQGMNLFAGGHGGGKFYWSWNMPAFSGPRGSYALTVDPSTHNGDYAEVKIHSPWSGRASDAAMDVDVYYSLTRGAHGYYATATIHHPDTYPRNPGGEWRSNTYIGSIFDWLSVDAKRNQMMASPADSEGAERVPGAPKEVTLLKSGIYAGQFQCKYEYSADLGDLDVWGWSSSSKHVGIWMTVPSHEYYNGGPMKTELTGHNTQSLLNMLSGGHYSMGNAFSMAAGTVFKKTYGPFFVYANSYAGSAADPIEKVANALWKDAKAQAAAEQSAWPYTWFKNADYVQESGRGTVTGTLTVRDNGNPAASSAGAWIGLAPNDNGTDFQLQARTYQFWVKTDQDGHFTLPHVLPGTYNLWAFGARNIGTFKQANVEVTAAKMRDLGTIVWQPARVAPTVWEIGIPDRDSKEFYNGAHNYSLWATSYSNREFTEGLTYTIGQSDWTKDWNYTHINSVPWTINFNLAQAPAANSPASLYIGLASSETTLNVKLNDTPIGTYRSPTPAHAVIRLGSHGPFSETRMAIPAELLKKGANTIVINQTAGTTEYDYIRLEATGTEIAAPSSGPH